MASRNGLTEYNQFLVVFIEKEVEEFDFGAEVV